MTPQPKLDPAALLKDATPGPWRVYEHNSLVIVCDDETSLGDMDSGDPERPYPEQRANTALAAAAPALAAELIAVTAEREQLIEVLREQRDATHIAEAERDRLAARVAELERLAEMPRAIMLQRYAGSGLCVVSIQNDNDEFIPVIRDNGDVISHIVEPSGIRTALAASQVSP